MYNNKKIYHIYKDYKIDTDVVELISSLCRKNSLGNGLIDYFIRFFTVMIDRCKSMMNHPLSNWSVDKFTEDWYNTFGEGTTINKK